MSRVRVLSDKDISQIINLKSVVAAVEDAYKQKSNNEGNVWPMVFYEYEHEVFDLDIRSGNLAGSGAYGLKLLSYNENNPERGISKVNATAIVCNDKTGEPLAILNAAPITSYRTGAAAAIGAKYLAKDNSENLLVVGTGNIAKYSTAAMLLLIRTIKRVYLYNSRRTISKDELLAFRDEVSRLLRESGDETDVEFSVVDDLSGVVRMSDIVVTATPSEKAMINDEWVMPGTHFSCMGAGTVGKQEIDEKTFIRARTFADDETQCLECGEAQCAYNKKLFSGFNGEIGDILLGKIDGRTSEDDITIFDSTGLFLQDLATAMELVKESNMKNVGMEIEL